MYSLTPAQPVHRRHSLRDHDHSVHSLGVIRPQRAEDEQDYRGELTRRKECAWM
jgi:hypothetical protein